MCTEIKIDTPVNEAAKFLDLKCPNWWTKINLHKLTMWDSNYCILGQIFAGNRRPYIHGRDLFGIPSGSLAFGERGSVAEWSHEITMRMNTNTVEIITEKVVVGVNIVLHGTKFTLTKEEAIKLRDSLSEL